MSKVIIILTLCGAFLLSVSYAAESTEQRLKAWDNWKLFTTPKPFTQDRFDPTFWKRFTWNPPTWNPPTWNPSTFKEIDSIERKEEQPLKAPDTDWWKIFTTQRPFILDRSDPTFWKKFTWKPIKWNTPTWKEKDNIKRKGDDSYLYILLIVPIAVIVLILTKLGKNVRCSSSSSVRNTRSSSSIPTVSGDSYENEAVFVRDGGPRVVFRPITPYHSASTSNGTSRAANVSIVDGISVTVNRSTAININGRSENAADKPPGYGEVVSCDLLQEQKFPEVKPSEHETPPPAYDFASGTKY